MSNSLRPRQRVSALVFEPQHGTCLAPAVFLRAVDNRPMVYVLIEGADGPEVKRTCASYVDVPLPETAESWQAAYQRLEAEAVKHL